MLRDLDLAVDEGEMVAVIGASGVGQKYSCCTSSGGLDASSAGR